MMKASGPRGTELTGKDLEAGLVPVVRYRPEARYAWSAGQAMSRFLEELKAGRFIGRRCNRCRRVLFPPRMFCEECYRPTDAWVHVQDTGTIETYSISYIDTDAKRITEPILVGVVSLDGASPGMGLMHFFGEMTKDEVHIGMRVKAVWRPPEHRVGSVLDIAYFRPLREKEG